MDDERDAPPDEDAAGDDPDELEEPAPPVGTAEPLGLFELVREWIGARFGRR